MTKRIFLASLLALTLGHGVARADAPAENAEQQVLDSITRLRAAQQLPPLRRDAALDEAALIHAEDMAAHDFVGHVSDRTGDPASRARAVGADVRRVGENVARGASPEAALASLEASDAHRAQILSSEFSTVGVAVVEDDEGFYVVEVFGAPLAAAPAPVAATEVPPPVVADVHGSLEADLAAAVADAEACDDCEGESMAIVVRDAQPTAVVPSADAVAAAAPIAPAPSVAPSVDWAEASAQASYPQASYPQASYPQPSYPQPSYPQSTPPARVGQTGVQFPGQVANGQVATQQGYAPASASTAGAPIVMLQGVPARTVAGYWVQAGGRWWYYPVPANARPGQQLQPSTTAPASPTVYGAAPQTPAFQPYATGYRGRPGLFRPSPRRF